MGKERRDLRNNGLSEETLSVLRDRRNNGNEIRENSRQNAGKLHVRFLIGASVVRHLSTKMLLKLE